ncbi:MAG: bifunctional [glutamate--ammonia ligase]-adenylyl-L-tyrosine phosphorylase/[glutamate--ammonia-ligase] adenylyltransferase [Rhodoferax sp.]|nr:bifunctional [glutamate--ammonia ligase]-adenylyl-L-tyrosine phosphorylase/[glutamate--ammonia-ligase] adenylyltransferase [Rhodoferax sp.]
MTRNELPPLCEGSRFGQRIRRRYANLLHLMDGRALDGPGLASLVQALRAQGHELSAALRVARQLVMERLIQVDCANPADLPLVTATMTQLAELTLELAYHHSFASLAALHGQPLTPQGELCQLCILGMGKLGARELNVSSDIDLIYVYDQDGDTAGLDQGRGRISNQEFFAKMVKAIYSLVGEASEHGMVFRVDLALRPNGNSGPPAVSLGALEEYFHVQGREWERFAWLKSRVVAPVQAIGSGCAQQLRGIVVPFVFRRYLDYNVFDSLRGLHRQIREHAAKRSAGRPERSNDVKLSRGGIREIEFTVQLLQVVRGGQYPELRTRPTLSALQRLVRAGLMPQTVADGLARAYVFLRQVEHRIQYLDDQQTHVLPTDEGDLQWIAKSLGLADSTALLQALDQHRELVAQEFDALLGGAPGECKQCTGKSSGSASLDLDAVLGQLHGRFLERVTLWSTHPRVLALRDESRYRLCRLVLRSAQWQTEGRVSEEACVRLADWMEALLRRESYLAMLLERPKVHERLLRMLGAARWPARYLLTHPGVIDELASRELLEERFDAQAFEGDLERRLLALQGTNEEDDESLLNLLRRAHHAEVFRTLARDVEGRLTVEQVADDLSALAEAVLRITTRWCWARLKKRHREAPLFAIIAYGKLGGKELGYGSDLDIVFVYDDSDDNAPETYAALVRKLINWLTVKTGEGDLYEIDTALRPNGNSGLLVSSMTAFANYQERRGSNTAWTWEHQAMTRARCVLGSDALQQRFEEVRANVMATPRDVDALKLEISTMRGKMRQGHPVPAGRFDLKHSPGGMVDIEFAVQFMVLGHGAQHPQLLPNLGNITLLHRAQACGLVPAPLGEQAALAYRALRQLQHRARLNEDANHLPQDPQDPHQTSGLALWQSLFAASTP